MRRDAVARRSLETRALLAYSGVQFTARAHAAVAVGLVRLTGPRLPHPPGASRRRRRRGLRRHEGRWSLYRDSALRMPSKMGTSSPVVAHRRPDGTDAGNGEGRVEARPALTAECASRGAHPAAREQRRTALGVRGVLHGLDAFHYRLESRSENSGCQLGHAFAIVDSGFDPFLDQPLL